MNGQMSPTSQPPPPSSATGNSQAAPPAKKKRNHPGNPNPEAEVIALSPKTLMATNRFVCEVCNKGFQREQNLQLHRRGHNLPWKLKQKSGKEVRRRVYLCPEPGCVHHDPSRALGDLTGVKKHFSRKHGEKKWKCEKCAKRYAVKSDCKAHLKTCGTREYRCDCGVLFSRRDSFITHRAFCDALAQENSNPPSGVGTFASHFYRNNSDNNNNNNSISHGISQLNSSHPSPDLLRRNVSGRNVALATQYDHLISPPTPSFSFDPPPSGFFLAADALQSKPSLQSPMQFPTSSNPYNPNFFSNTTFPLVMHDQFDEAALMNNHIQSLFVNSVENDNGALPQLSATAMLQRAAQMGSSSSLGDRILSNQVENDENHLLYIMNSFANGNSGVFATQEEEEGEEIKYQKNGLTRDFLGVGSVLRSMGRGMVLDRRDLNDSETSNRSFDRGDSLH